MHKPKLKHLFSLLCLWLTGLSVFAWNAPSLLSPTNGSTIYTGNTLDWTAVSGSDGYQLQLDTSPSFNSPGLYNVHKSYINSSSSNSDTREAVEDLFFGQTYYWRVRAYVTNDTSAWVQRTFTTRDDVSLSSPISGTFVYAGATLDWLAHYGVDFYDLELDTSATFNSPAKITHTETYINTSSANSDTYEFVDDLYFGTTYYWRVRARNAVDTSGWSTVWTINTRDYVLHNSPATNTDQWTGVTLDWLAHYGVDFYDLEVDTSAAFNSPAKITHTESYINTSSSNSDTYEFVDDLYFGKTYYWRVRARNAVDTTTWSTAWTFQTRDYVTLNSPSNNSTQWTGVTLDWLSHHGVDYYDLEVDTSASFNSPAKITHSDAYVNSSSSNPDTYEFVDDLFFGKTYYWRVRARNAVDTSGWSTVRTFNTQDNVTLSSPSNNTNQWTGLTLDWLAHHGVDYYDLEVDTSTSFNSPAKISHSDAYVNSSSSNSDTYEFIDDLYFGTTYYWRVRARNAVDTSGWSTVWAFQTRDYVNQNSPSDNSTQWTGLTMDWFAHTGVDYYDLEMDTSASFNSTAKITHSDAYVNSSSSNSDTYEFIDDLYFGTTYYWRVRARNAVDTSGWSTVRTFHTRDYVSLNSPNNGATNIPTTGTTLDWLSHAGVDRYEMELDQTNLFNSGSLASVSLNYINTSSSNSDTRQATGPLVSNTVYFWRVRAINAVDTCSWTTWTFSTGVPINIPSAPTLISPTNGATAVGTGPTLDWSDVTNATSYEYQYSTNLNFSGATSGTSTASMSAISGLSSNTTYYWRVRAFNGSIVSNWSSVFSFNTGLNAPGAPILLSPADGSVNQGTAATLDWEDVSGASSYFVEWSDNSGFTGSSSTTVTPSMHSVSGLNSNTLYYWRVQAINGGGSSAFSTVWSFNTGCSVQQPSAQGTGVCSGESVMLSASGANDYNWYDSQNGGTLLGTGSTLNLGTVTQSDTFWVAGTDGNCESSREEVVVVVFPLPATPAIQQIGNDSLTSTVTGTSYQWFLNGQPVIANAQTIFVNQNGDYQVQVVDANGCVSDTSGVFTFMLNGLEELESQIQVYPVPNRGNFTVQVPAGASGVDLRVISVLGRTVWSQENVSTGEVEVNLGNCVSGVYWVIIENENGTARKKISVMK